MQHRALDGSVVSIDDPSDDLFDGFTSIGNVRIEQRLIELVGADIEGSRSIFNDGFVPDEVRVMRLGGGRKMTIGTKTVHEYGADYHSEFVMLEGKRNGLTTWQPAGQPTSLAEIVSSLDLTEEDKGMTVQSGEDWRWDGDLNIVKGSSSRMLVEVEPKSADVAARLPKWRGARVRGGELFAKDVVRADVSTGRRAEATGSGLSDQKLDGSVAAAGGLDERLATRGLVLVAERAVISALAPPAISAGAFQSVVGQLAVDWQE